MAVGAERSGPGSTELASAGAQARSGDLAGAETSFRAVLARQPNNGGALIGLAGVLTRRGHDAEAQTLLARAGADRQRPGGRHRRKAEQLRLQAQQTGDPDAAIALLRAASDAAPADPWIRLDLARALAKQGNGAEAQAVMAPLTEAAHPSPEALHAAALFAMENNHPGEAAGLAERIPAGSRGADMNRLLAKPASSSKCAGSSPTRRSAAMRARRCWPSPPRPIRTARGARRSCGPSPASTTRPERGRPSRSRWPPTATPRRRRASPMPARCWPRARRRTRAGW